jgi:hypothetical protein
MGLSREVNTVYATSNNQQLSCEAKGGTLERGCRKGDYMMTKREIRALAAAYAAAKAELATARAAVKATPAPRLEWSKRECTCSPCYCYGAVAYPTPERSEARRARRAAQARALSCFSALKKAEAERAARRQ